MLLKTNINLLLYNIHLRFLCRRRQIQNSKLNIKNRFWFMGYVVLNFCCFEAEVC
jgi:hypothetical protein